MRRAMVCSVFLGAAAITVVTAGAALAGGGCHEAATQDDATGRDETTVSMMDACFTASVSRVEPGTIVTFVNEDDGVTHNVGGNLWGYHGDMIPGDTFTATFDDPGVYPFACSYHPGMIGAIVVGDGFGVGDGWTVHTTSLEAEPEVSKVEPMATSDAPPAPGTVVAGLLGLVVGAGAALGLSRVGKKPSTT